MKVICVNKHLKGYKETDAAGTLILKQANPKRFWGRFFKVGDGATRAGGRFLDVCEWGVVFSDRA
jgi:hypothetical protein